VSDDVCQWQELSVRPGLVAHLDQGVIAPDLVVNLKVVLHIKHLATEAFDREVTLINACIRNDGIAGLVKHHWNAIGDQGGDHVEVSFGGECRSASDCGQIGGAIDVDVVDEIRCLSSAIQEEALVGLKDVGRQAWVIVVACLVLVGKGALNLSVEHIESVVGAEVWLELETIGALHRDKFFPRVADRLPDLINVDVLVASHIGVRKIVPHSD